MFTKMESGLPYAAHLLPLSTLLALALTSAAFAAPPGDIVLGDITVMRLTTPVGNVTAEQRASMVQDRINQAISIPNITDKDVRLVVEQSGPTIYVRKIKIVTIDPGTASSQGVTPLELGKTWAHRLMGVIAQVCIRVPVTPPGGGAAIAATTPPAPPAAGPATPAVPAAPVSPTAAPAQPSQPAAPAVPAAPASPAAPAKPSPVTTPVAPATPAAPVTPSASPVTPPAAPPAVPVTPPATPPTPPAGG